MNIQDAVGVGLDKGGGDFPEKAGQEESVDLPRLKFRQVGIAVLEAVALEPNGLNVMIFSDLKYTCRLPIAGDQGDPDLGMTLKIPEDGCRVGASAGGEYGESDHGFLRRPSLPASLAM